MFGCETMSTKFLKVFALTAALGISVLVFSRYLFPAIAPFVFGGVIAYFLHPLTLQIKHSTKMGYRPSAVATIILFYGSAIILVWNLGFLIFVQTVALFTKLPNDYLSNMIPAVSDAWEDFTLFIQNILPATTPYIKEMSTSITTLTHEWLSQLSTMVLLSATEMAKKLPGIVFTSTISILSSFLILMDYDGVKNFILHLFPKAIKKVICYSTGFMVSTTKKIVKAYFLLMLLTFTEVTIGLWLLGIEYFATMGAVVAAVDILPILGSGIVLVPWSIFIMLTGNTAQGVGILILYGVITIVRTCVEPKVVGEKIGLHPLVTIISMYTGTKLFGFFGLILCPIFVTLITHLQTSGKLKLFFKH